MVSGWDAVGRAEPRGVRVSQMGKGRKEREWRKEVVWQSLNP